MKLLITLNDIAHTGTLALFGAGQAGSNFLEIIKRFRPDLHVRCFIDSYKKGEKEGIPIINAEDYLREKNPVNSPHNQGQLLITSINWREIETLLLEREVNDYLIIPPRFLFPSAYQRLSANRNTAPCENPLSAELFSATDTRELRPQLEAVEKLLPEPGDRDLFRILTGQGGTGTNRLEAVARFYYNSPLKRQYFDYVSFDPVRTVIEGGVADGADSLELLKKQLRVYGFEPNRETYLKSPYKKSLDANPFFKMYHKGLWSEPMRIPFEIDGFSSEIVPGQTVTDEHKSKELIEVVSIDSFVEKEKIERVDFIKMDIEGAELEALKGAVDTMKRFR
ncbi:MAG: FkbM family methyltransferase, partial [bacterium]|nr:FkbM family methyltransferase [bacterium]